MDFETLCIHGVTQKYDVTGALSIPIFQSATFSHPGVGQSTGFDYTRTQNPTRAAAEQMVAALESGTDAIGFSSGMAAITALMELFSPGDHLIVSDDLYGGTHRLFNRISKKNGIAFTTAGTPDHIHQSCRSETKAVFIETPTNPMMHVVDIEEVSRFTAERNLLLIVDNTFLTPYFQKPLRLGADLVLHSGTKYLSGHNDTLSGFLVTKDRGLAGKVRAIAETTGACLSPFDSFLTMRGIKTLAVRLERQQRTALSLAEWLSAQGPVEAVYYPGLKNHPGYETSCRQATGFGGMLSFSVRDAPSATRVLERVRVIKYAESLGGVESLITYPMMQTHADIPEKERLAKGINDTLLRLSVGLESFDDLTADLSRALEPQHQNAKGSWPTPSIA